MTPERRYLWIAVGVVSVGVLALFLVPKLREDLAPEPISAMVAVQLDRSQVAETGRVDIAAGHRFTLHAVLLAEGRDGQITYYTEAPRLFIDGAEVPRDRLRRWDRSGEMAILWFTIEGYRPFDEVDSLERLDEFRFEESFRPDWGRGWTVAGSVAPRNHALARGEEGREIDFGTARYHIRVERYFRAGDPAPLARFRSPGAADVHDLESGPTTLVARLDGGLGRVSAPFGLPQIEPADGASRQVIDRLAGWYRNDLAFSRLLVLGGILEDRGLAWAELEWMPVDLEERPNWEPLGAGDLLRAGERIVVLYEDHGEPGIVDYEDLCFDFAESAAVRRLGDVFVGGGVLNWTDLEPGGAGEENEG